MADLAPSYWTSLMIFKELISSLQAARRPIFVWGAGIRPYAEAALALARSLGIPVACTWGAIDLVHHDDPLMAGGFGTHGTRAANFAVQNADLVISIGSRLDTKATGHPPHFARGARIAMVDIDQAEIDKMPKVGRHIDFPICADAGVFMAALQNVPVLDMHDHSDWFIKINGWKFRYSDPQVTWPGVNPYELMREIGKYTTKDDIICTDTGFALGWTMQAFPFKGERFLHAFNMTPMGYGISAAVGAAFASQSMTKLSGRVILITGDGSIMMGLSELATIARWNLPIKIILLNNRGHGMCRQTQRQWLGGKYPATNVDGGLGFPDFQHTALAFDIDSRQDWEEGLNVDWLFETDRARLLEVHVHQDAQLIPQARYGQPLEDADPQLPRDEFLAQMIVAPL